MWRMDLLLIISIQIEIRCAQLYSYVRNITVKQYYFDSAIIAHFNRKVLLFCCDFIQLTIFCATCNTIIHTVDNILCYMYIYILKTRFCATCIYMFKHTFDKIVCYMYICIQLFGFVLHVYIHIVDEIFYYSIYTYMQSCHDKIQCYMYIQYTYS